MASACDSQAEMGDQGAQQSFLMPAASPVLHGVVVPGPGAGLRNHAGVDGDGIKWSNEANTAQMIFLQTELHPIVPQQVLQQPSLQSTSSGPRKEDVTCFISVDAASPAPQNQPQRTQDHTPLPGPQAAGHAGQGERPVKTKKQSQCVCPQCGRDCAKPSVLQKHVRSHTGERPFPCNTCKVSFKTQSNLYKHKRTQTHVNNSRGGVGAGGQGGSLTSSGGPSGTRALPAASDSIPNAGPLPSPQPARCATVCAPQSAQWGSVGEAAEKLFIGSESLESHQTGSRNLVLQRQQATCFPEQRFAEWSSSSSSLQTTGSTDSGYSDSTEQLTWASSPPQSLQEPSAEPAGALRRFVGNAEQSPARELPISGLDKRSLEERISKLISDNEAVVDDKHLDIVRPRKSILSKQGSIDLPMPYTYKDSFHFDMKSSQLNRKTDLESIRRAKQSVFSSLPSHSCATVGFSQVTRSNSLPPGAGQASPSTQLTPHRQPLQRGAATAQCKDPSSPGLQPSLSRTLVRQAALDWLPSAQGECLAPAPVPGARKATHGKRGATEKRKLQKFSPERWSVYGEGTFRKIYQAKSRGSTPFTAQAANPAPASTPASTPTTSTGAASTPTSTPTPSITSTSTPAPSTSSASTPAPSKASASTTAPSKASASTTAPSIASTPASSKAPTSNPGPTPMPSSTPAPLPTPHPRLVRQMSILVPERSPGCCGVSVSRERVPVGVSETQRGSGTGSGWPWARLRPTDSRGSVSSQTASDSPSPSPNPSQALGSHSPPQHPQNQLPGKGALLPRKASQRHNDFLPKYQLTRLSEEVSVSLGARSPSHSAQPIAEQQLRRESQEPALPAAWARYCIVCDTVTVVASGGHCPAVIRAESAHPPTGCSSPIAVTRRHTSASAQTPAALAHLVTQRFSAEPWASEKGIHARLVPQREGQTGRTDPEPSTEVHSAAACSDGAYGDHTATTMSPAASSAKPAVSYCLPEELTSNPAAHLLPFPTLQSEPKPTWCFLSKSIPLAGGQGLTSAYATWPTCSGNPAASHMAAKDTLSLHCLKQSEQQPASSIEKSPMTPQSQCLQQEDATTFLRKNETEHRRSNRKRTATWNRGHRTDEVSVWASSRGKQRSQQCGIGCEKPSALRTNRHRHSHTSARPYRCSLCTSAFKTKGNLTKHMKLKVHRKLRLRLRDASANQEQTRKPKVDINEAATDNQREQVAGRQSQVTPREAAQPLPLTNSTNPFPGSNIDAAFTADEPRITLVPLSSVHPTLNVQHGPSPAAQCTALPLDSIAGTWALLVPRSSVGSLCSQLPGGSFPLDALPISQGQKSSATMCFLKKQTSPVASLSVSTTLVQTISEPSNSQVCVLAKTLTASPTKMSGISGSVSQNSGINPAFTGSLLPVVPQVTQSAVAITTCTASDGSPFAVDTQRRQGEPKPNQDVPSLAVLLRGASKDMEPLLMTVIPAEVGEAGPPCLVLALTTAALSTLTLPPLAPTTLAPPTSTGPTLAPSTLALPILALPTLALPTLGQLSRAPLAPDALTVLPACYSPSKCPDSSRYTQMLEVKPSESVRQPPCPVLHPVLSPQAVPTGHANLPRFPEPSQSQGAQGPAALRGSGRPSGVGSEDTASRSHPAHLSHPELTRASKHSPSPTTGQKAAVTATCEVPLPASEEVPSLQYQDSLWSGSEVARLSQSQQVTQPIATPQARRERTVRQTRADYSDTSSDEDRLVIEA